MALPATATFTATNGVQVNSLADWDGCAAGVNGDGLDIQTNAAQADLAGRTHGDWWVSDTFANNQYSQATVVGIATGVYVGVGVRMSGTSGSQDLSGYLFYGTDTDSGLDKYVDGAYDSTLDTGIAFEAGDIIRIEISGNAITCKINGATELSYTDSTSPITSGAAGICAYADGASQIDDWEGGDLSTALTINKSETVTISESRTIVVSEAAVSKTETVAITEDVTASIQVDPTINTSQPVSVGETISLALADLVINLTQSIAVAETVSVAVIEVGGIAISVSDSAAVAETYPVNLDSAAISQTETISVSASPTLSLIIIDTTLSILINNRGVKIS